MRFILSRWMVLAVFGMPMSVLAGAAPPLTAQTATPSTVAPASIAESTPAAIPQTKMPSLDPIAQKLMDTQKEIADLTANFTLTVFDPASGQKNFQAEGKLWLASGRRYCVQYTKPERQRLVSDGKKRWLYLEKINQVQIQPLPPAGSAQEFFLELGGGLAPFLETCQVSQKALPDNGWLFKLKPRPESTRNFSQVHIWVNGEKFAPSRIWIEAEQNVEVWFDAVRIHTLAEVKADPGRAVPKSTFLFTPPANAEVIDMLWTF